MTEHQIVLDPKHRDSITFYLVKERQSSSKLTTGRTIVFTNTVDQTLRLLGIFSSLYPENPNTPSSKQVFTLHARLQQKQRLKNLERFRKSENGVLIATDVACRGLDIPNVERVIHYSPPMNSDIYIHRSGRTARAGRTGDSICLMSSEESIKFHKILGQLKKTRPLDYELNNDILKKIILPVVILAEKADQIKSKQRRASSNNKFVNKIAQALDLDEENTDVHLKNHISNDEKSKLRELELRIEKELPEKIYF